MIDLKEPCFCTEISMLLQVFKIWSFLKVEKKNYNGVKEKDLPGASEVVL